jgi:hypothetical protein
MSPHSLKKIKGRKEGREERRKEGRGRIENRVSDITSVEVLAT